MASSSIRVSTDLFDRARDHGALMSRSAAQQLEHWARLGMALEASGMSSAHAADLLRGGEATGATPHEPAPSDPWLFKRQQQKRDVEAVKSGRSTNERMSWFAGGRAKAARLKSSPY